MAKSSKNYGKMLPPAYDKSHAVPHWALMPFVAGVMIGLALSTVILIRPYTESITNVYIRLPEEEQRRDLRKLMDELQPYRVGGVDRLSQEVTMKDPVYYALIMQDRHSSEQLEVLRDTWAKNVPLKDINFFIPSESPEDINDMDFHYGEIESDHAIVELPHSQHNMEIQVLKYICKHKINDTKWFLIASGDVYIKSNSLENYLRQHEHIHQMSYIGKPLKRDPIGRVCMPGTGAVLSYSALAALCPNLHACAASVGSELEEYVIGACLKQQLDLQCNKEGQVSTSIVCTSRYHH